MAEWGKQENRSAVGKLWRWYNNAVNGELRDQADDPDLYNLLKLDSPIDELNPLDMVPIKQMV